MTTLKVSKELWDRFSAECRAKKKNPTEEAKRALLSRIGTERALKGKNTLLLKQIAKVMATADVKVAKRKVAKPFSMDQLRAGLEERKRKEREQLLSR